MSGRKIEYESRKKREKRKEIKWKRRERMSRNKREGIKKCEYITIAVS